MGHSRLLNGKKYLCYYICIFTCKFTKVEKGKHFKNVSQNKMLRKFSILLKCYIEAFLESRHFYRSVFNNAAHTAVKSYFLPFSGYQRRSPLLFHDLFIVVLLNLLILFV